MSRARRIALVWIAWTAIDAIAVLLTLVRIRTGEAHPGPGWIAWTFAGTPLWALVTPPLLALSRRFPIERRAWPRAVLAHLVGLAAVLVADGVMVSVLARWLPGPRLTFWQEVWKYSFIDAFFYAGVVAVEHAARYHRLYVDRRVRASELEAQVARAQLQALQMQIRPHFLFNTLNTISALVRTGEHDAAIVMLAGLGDLLRLLLRSDGAQVVPVRRELEMIERYLQLEQARFGDQLAIEVDVEAGVEDALVPSLILQPLVENAVRHGIAAATSAGRVAVHVGRDGDTLRLAVHDSGDASAPELDPGDRERGGIGLRNTRARLERLYGDAHRFDLARTDAGTRAVIEIPLRRAAEGAP
jgi:two-component sensor histidine kinase